MIDASLLIVQRHAPESPTLQRFLDLETFQTEAEANERAIAGAMAWIDAAKEPDRLALPSDFAPLD